MLGRWVTALLAPILASLILVSTAAAADITGTWDLPSGSVAHQTWTFTAGTGTLAGEGGGGPYTWPMEGTISGGAVQIKTAYRETSYTAYFVGTVSADGTKMTGTWDTGSFAAAQASMKTWLANRTGAAPAPTPTPEPTPAPAPTPTPTPTPVDPATCTNAETLLVTCAADPIYPGLCSSTGVTYPQCYAPANLPVVCGPSGTILVACQPPANYVMACGGFGTILPECHLPPPSLPQVCGPSGTLLPPCTGANNPVTVCGGSGTILPVCSFSGPITAKPLNLDEGTGEVDIPLSCPAPLVSYRLSGAWAAKAKPATCDGSARLESLRTARIASLREGAVWLGKCITIQPPIYKLSDATRAALKAVGMTDTELLRLWTANTNAFAARAERHIQYWFGKPTLPKGYPIAPERGTIAGELQSTPGSPPYQGPSVVFSPGCAGIGLQWANAIRAAYDEYRSLYLQTKGSASASASAVAGAAKNVTVRVTKHLKLKQSAKRTRIRIKLSRATVRKLGQSVGKGAKVVPVRVIVSFKAKPMPVVKVFDIPLRIKR